MAKKQTVSMNIFDKTTPSAPPQDNSDLDRGNIKPTGVGLSEGEIAALDAMGAEYELARNALIRIATRLFIFAYRRGEIDLNDYVSEPPPQKKKPKYPTT